MDNTPRMTWEKVLRFEVHVGIVVGKTNAATEHCNELHGSVGL